MKLKSLIQLVLGILMGTALAVPGYSQTDAPTNFRIKSVTMTGDGCNQSHATLTISSDNQAFTAIFDEFTAELTRANSAGQVKKKCHLKFDTEQDLGWEFAIVAVTARGYAALDAGVVGHQALIYGVGGGGEREKATIVLRGPFNDDYINAAAVPAGEIVFSGCNPVQNINRTKDFVVGTAITIKTQRTGATGLLTVDSLDGKLQMDYDLIWRHCAHTNDKSVAVCQVSAADSSGRAIVAKGVGKDPATALTKARANISGRCAKAVAHGVPSCVPAQAVCKPLLF